MKVVCSCCEKSVDETTSAQLLHKPDVKICFDCLNWLNGQRDRHDAAHSGGWVVSGCEPILVVAEMARAVDHYRKLGFEVTNYDEGYAFAAHGTMHLHLQLTDGGEPRPGGGLVYVHCEDADEVVAEWRKAGLEVTSPENKPWGKYDGSHVDPDGNLIRFGSPRRV